MIEELGLSGSRVEPAAVSKNRYLAHQGRLVAVPSPSAPAGFLTTPLLTMGAKLKVAAESSYKPRTGPATSASPSSSGITSGTSY